MPEAAVDEYHRPVTRQHQVRSAWQIVLVEAEPVSEAVDH